MSFGSKKEDLFTFEKVSGITGNIRTSENTRTTQRKKDTSPMYLSFLPFSYKQFESTHKISAKIRIKKTSENRRIRKRRGGGNQTEYLSLLQMIRKKRDHVEMNPFCMVIMPFMRYKKKKYEVKNEMENEGEEDEEEGGVFGGWNDMFFIEFEDIKKIESNDSKRELTIFEKYQEFFHIQFELVHDYSVIKKYIQTLLEIDGKLAKYGRKKGGLFNSISRRESEKIMMGNMGIEEVIELDIQKSTNLAIKSSSNLKSNGIYNQKKVEDWEPTQIRSWMKKTFIYDEFSDKIMTMLVYLTSNFSSDFQKMLFRYFTEHSSHNLFRLRKRIVEMKFNLMKVLVFDLNPNNDKSKNEKIYEKEKSLMKKHYEKLRHFCESLENHIGTLEYLELSEDNRFYSKPFYKCCQKLVSKLKSTNKKKGRKNDDVLTRVSRMLKFEYVYFWDYIELRDYILVLLLFNTPLHIREEEKIGNVKNSIVKKDVVSIFEESLILFCLTKQKEERKRRFRERYERDTDDDDDDEDDYSSTSESEKNYDDDSDDLKEDSFLIGSDDDESDDDTDEENEKEELKKFMGGKKRRKRSTRKKKLSFDMINPVKFEGYLKEFNQNRGFELQNVSFQFRTTRRLMETKKKIIELEKKRKEMKSKKKVENQNLKNKIDILKEEKGLKEKQIWNISEEIFKNVNNPGYDHEGEANRMTTIQKDCERLKKVIESLVLQMKENKKTYKDVIIQKIKDLKEQIEIQRTPFDSNAEWEFLRSKKRRENIRKMIQRRIAFLHSTYGYLEIVVKIVLSQFKNAKVEDLQETIMKIVERYKRFEFFKFGFIHSSITLKNVGFNWGTDEVVDVRDLNTPNGYQELFCCDCFCPLFLNDEAQLYEIIEDFSQNVVHYNAEVNYSSWGMGGIRTTGKNCQHITMKILKILKYTSFYKEIWEYIEQVKFISKHIKKDRMNRETLCARFFEIKDPEFERRFSKVIEGCDFWNKEERKVYFLKHKDLDEFYTKLQHEFDLQQNQNVKSEYDKFTNPLEFADEYPGVFQLLKGFDRSFWMLKGKEGENTVTKEFSGGCPFIKKRKKGKGKGMNDGIIII